MPGRKEDQDYQVLVKLCSLLRQNESKILSGECKFALTTQSLSMISSSFRRLSDVEYTDGGMSTVSWLSPQNSLKWKEDVNYLRDFISRCPSLKIIHGSNTMQGAIQVHRFRNLRVLEIKKVPVHMIEGLNQLRGQLQTLIISRSLLALQDLFETCGSDMTSPMSWPQLDTANLSYNTLTCFDSSLRLLPVLKIVDISHNSLEKTDHYLEYLTELQRINLGYNMLDSIPSFSLSVKNRLRTLVLKNNSLDNIQGVEELTLLEELDICDNCLVDHQTLQPLVSLVTLNQLRLVGNPIYYHKRHRKLTVKYLSSLTVSTIFELDNKKLTSKEILYNEGVNMAPSRRPSTIVHTVISESRRQTVRGNLISKDYKFSDSDNIATSLPVSGKRKKKKRNKNRVSSDISDLDSSTTEFDSPDVSAASSPRPDFLREAMKTRKEIELYRSHYGPDWLKVMDEEHGRIRQNDPATSGTSDSEPSQTRADVEKHPNLISNCPTDDDLYLLETSGNYQKTKVKVDQNSIIKTEVKVNTRLGVKNEVKPDKSDVVVTVETDVQKKEFVKDESPEGIYVTKETKEVHVSVSRMYSMNGGEEFNRTDEEEEAFYGEESEPFIVSHENDSQHKEIILTFNERYLMEKDLNGCIIDKFDLKCLKNYDHSEKIQDDVRLPVMVLYFDYIKKDRRLKSYVMEDQASVQRLIDFILPYLVAQELKSVDNTLYQCLKCSNQFLAKNGQVVENSKLPSRGSSKDLNSINHSGKSSFKCPKCSSELVIEVEGRNTSDTGSGSASSTPYGSYTASKDKFYSPTQTRKANTSPLAKSTPLKNESDKNLMSDVPARRNILSNLTTEKSAVKKSVTLVTSGKGDDLDLSKEGRRRSNAFISIEDKRSVETETESQQTQSLGAASDSEKEVGKVRVRLPSESDITILKSSLTRSQNSQSSLQSLDKNFSRETSVTSNPDSALINDISNQKNPKGERTPVGSPLSSNVCNDMVSSIYLSSVVNNPMEQNELLEKTNTSDISVVCDESENNLVDSMYNTCNETTSSFEDDIVPIESSTDPSVITLPESGNSDMAVISVDSRDTTDSTLNKNIPEDDFTEIDHRLKLHLMMSLFENTEEFKCIIETDVCQYLVTEEYHAFIILSTDKFYVLKILTQNRNEPPASWLKCLDIQPVTELFHVDIGLGYQTLRLEFGTDCSSYTLIIRDEKRCQHYFNFLQEIFACEDFLLHHQMKTYFTQEVCPMSTQRLQSDVLTKKNGEERILVCYLLGFIVRGMNPRFPVSFVITDDEILLVKENHQWPQPRLQAPLDKDTTAKQFIVLERHKITNIVTVENFWEDNTALRLTLLDEESGGETVWNITMETKHGIDLLIEAIRTPWEAEFGVDLEITEGVCEEA